jgi:heme A synthase
MLFVVTIPLALGFLGVIIYFALSKESSRIVRFAALIALGAAILSVLVCGIIVVSGLGGAGEEPAMPDFLATEPALPAKDNTFGLVLGILFLLAFLVAVVVLSLKEQQKSTKEKLGTAGEK